MPSIPRRTVVSILYVIVCSVPLFYLIGITPEPQISGAYGNLLFLEFFATVFLVGLAGSRGLLPGSLLGKEFSLYYAVTGYLGTITAVLCLAGFVLAFFFLSLPTLMAAEIALSEIVSWININLSIPANVAMTIVKMGFAYLFFLLGIPVARLLLRLMPPKRKSVVRWLTLIPLAWLSYQFIGSIQFFQQSLDRLVQIPVVAPIAVYSLVAGICFPVLFRHFFPTSFLNDKYIILLRKFSSFADRNIPSKLYSSYPTEKQVVSLTPTTSRVSDWNPFQIAFTGINVLTPIRSIPVYLKAADEHWKELVDDYVRSASRVVIDISEGTEPIKEEMSMLKKYKKLDSTLVTQINKEKGQFDALDGSVRVAYSKSWVQSIPRFVIGFLFLNLIFSFGRNGIRMAIPSSSYIDPQGAQAAVVLIPLALLMLWVYVLIPVSFFRSSLDFQSSKKIRRWARSEIPIDERIDNRFVCAVMLLSMLPLELYYLTGFELVLGFVICISAALAIAINSVYSLNRCMAFGLLLWVSSIPDVQYSTFGSDYEYPFSSIYWSSFVVLSFAVMIVASGAFRKQDKQAQGSKVL